MTEKRNRKIRWCVVLLICNVLFIWGNSMLPGEVSGAISDWVGKVIAAIFYHGDGVPQAGRGLLRKLAHLTEFACLGALLTWLLSLLQKPRVFAIAAGVLVASVDETIQRIVPDRGPSIKDVLIDTSGVLLGMIFLLVGYTVCKKKAKQHQEDTPK
ncbi:MAG: VanZ family protein [Oscillospiraceae bacterium]|nr:VanZ family protein [Oscillospiraceae bacterium]